jgi:hypothetical protein
VAGVVVASVGAAALIGGILFNLEANSVAKSIEPPNIYQRNTESKRKNYETVSWVGYGVGAAGLVTGAVLYGIGLSKGSSSGKVALVPAVGPGLTGVALCGAF